jgi:hypothetical protein
LSKYIFFKYFKIKPYQLATTLNKWTSGNYSSTISTGSPWLILDMWSGKKYMDSTQLVDNFKIKIF